MWFLSLALLLLSSGAFAQQSLPQPPPEAVLAQASTLHQKGDFKGAVPLYREYLKIRPRSPDVISNLGAALAAQGQYAAAVAEYNKAIAIEPRNPRFLTNLGLAHYKTGNISNARDMFAKAQQIDPSRQVTLLLADCDVRLGDYKKAVALLEPIQKATPDDLGLDYLLGIALLQDKQTDRGSQVIDRILRRGDSAESRLLLGVMQLNTRDFAGARDNLRKAVALNPKLPDAHMYLGLALSGEQDPTEAISAFRAELAIDPNNFTAVFQLGVLAKQEQRYPEAQAMLERSLLLRPRDPGVRYQLATVELAMDKLEQARARLEGLVKESPGFTEAHVSLATVYYRLKRREDGDRERAIVRELTAKEQAAQPGGKSK